MEFQIEHNASQSERTQPLSPISSSITQGCHTMFIKSKARSGSSTFSFKSYTSAYTGYRFTLSAYLPIPAPLLSPPMDIPFHRSFTLPDNFGVPNDLSLHCWALYPAAPYSGGRGLLWASAANNVIHITRLTHHLARYNCSCNLF